MSVLSLTLVDPGLLPGDGRPKVEQVLCLNHLVPEPPHEAGLWVGLGGAQHLLRHLVLHDGDDLLADAEVVGRVLDTEVGGAAHALPGRVARGLAAVVGVVLEVQTGAKEPGGRGQEQELGHGIRSRSWRRASRSRTDLESVEAASVPVLQFPDELGPHGLEVVLAVVGRHLAAPDREVVRVVLDGHAVLQPQDVTQGGALDLGGGEGCGSAFETL